MDLFVVPVPQTMEDLVKLIVAIPVPQIMEYIMVVIQLVLTAICGAQCGHPSATDNGSIVKVIQLVPKQFFGFPCVADYGYLPR